MQASRSLLSCDPGRRRLNRSWKLLLIDDDEDDYVLLREMLEDIDEGKHRLSWAPDCEIAMDMLKASSWDAILVDYDLGRSDGLSFIRAAIASGCTVPLIMVTGRGCHELDVEAMEAGAAEYVSKCTLNASFLERIIRYSIEHRSVEGKLERMVKERTQALSDALEALKATEETLRQQNEEFSELTHQFLTRQMQTQSRRDVMPVGYLTTDTMGRILYADEEASLLLNDPPNILVDRLLPAYIIPAERRDLARQLILIKQERQMQNWRFHIAPNHLTQFEACLTVSPVSGKDFKIISLRWIIHPVSGGRSEPAPTAPADR